MALPSAQPRRGPSERALAWVMTGPLGHLWSALADIVEFSARRALEKRARRSGRD